MTSAEIEARLLDVLATMLDVPRQTIRQDASRTTLDVWDSLKHMQLILALEDDFKIEFSDQEISELASASDLVGAIVAKTAGGSR